MDLWCRLKLTYECLFNSLFIKLKGSSVALRTCLQIDIGEEELMITSVYNSGVVGTGKHISDSRCPKQL